MKRHDEMIFTGQPDELRARDARQTVGAQINSGRTRGIKRAILLVAITSVVVFGGSEARAQAPNAILKIEFGVDNAANTTAPKSVGDFQFTVSKPGEPPLFTFQGSEQVITVPLSDTSLHNETTTFVLSSVNQPAGYGPIYQGDCNPAGRIDLRSGEVKTCRVTNAFLTFAENGTTVRVLKITKRIDNTDPRGSSVQAADFTISVLRESGALVTRVPGSETGIYVGLNSVGENYSVREDPNRSFPDYIPIYEGDCGRTSSLTGLGFASCVITNAFLNATEPNPTGVLKIIIEIEPRDVPGEIEPQPRDFSITVSGGSQTIRTLDGSDSGVNVGVAPPGSGAFYVIRGNRNPRFPDYFPVLGGDCNQLGRVIWEFEVVKRTCVVKYLYTNSSEASNPPTLLKVIKRVENTGLPGETSDVRNFALRLTRGANEWVANFNGSQTGFNIGLAFVLPFGAHYTVSETRNPQFPNYLALFSGDCRADGFVGLVAEPGDVFPFLTCLVTNYSLATTERDADAVLKIIPRIDNTGPTGEPVPQTSDFPIRIFRDNTMANTVHGAEAGANIGLRGGENAFRVRVDRNPQFPNYLPIVGGDCNIHGQFTLEPGAIQTCVVTFSYLNATQSEDSNSVVKVIKRLENQDAASRPRDVSEFNIGVFRSSHAELIQSVQGSETGRNVGYVAQATNPIFIREIDPPADYIQLYSSDCISPSDPEERIELPALATCLVTNVFAGARPPVANNQTTSVNEDTTKSITLTATDPNGNQLSFSVVSPPAHGRLSGNAPNLVYTPDPNFNGADSVGFIARDSQFDSNTATVFINVLPVNDVPVATGRTVSAITETSTQIQLFATDVDGDALTVGSISRPAHGTVTVNGLIATYTSTDNYIGPDSFSYMVSDGREPSGSAAVNINVANGIVVGNVSKTETNSGINQYVFNVELLAPTTTTVTVQYATANGTAVAGSDYTAKSGTLSFRSGQTTASISIDVAGDQLFEIDEFFVLLFSNPVNAMLRNNSAAAVIINDDPLVGISEMNPSNATVEVGERVNLALTWTHPERWRLLDTIDFRIIDDQGSVMGVRFSEPTNTFSLFNPISGRYENPVTQGSPQRFETNAATMYVEDSRVQGSGPTGPSVVMTYSLSFKPLAAGRVFRVEAFATDDFGHQQGFDLVGTVTVQPQH